MLNVLLTVVVAAAAAVTLKFGQQDYPALFIIDDGKT